MKKLFNSIYIAGVLIVASCGGSDKSSTELNADIKNVNSIKNDTTANAASTSNSLPVTNQQTQPLAITSAANNTSGERLNPAHGQPGHDCAVDVGKPLPANGAAKTTNPVVTSNPVQTNNSVTAPAPTQLNGTTTTKAELNPAHGAPGHRCEIAVGAPLNSEPAKTSTPAITTTPSNGLPAKISIPPVTGTPPEPKPTVTTSPGLNPAHGAPGHRCDIAVGAPLPKQ